MGDGLGAKHGTQEEFKMAKANGKASDGQAKIRIQWYRSTFARPKAHKELVRSLGLTKLNQIVERPDTASMRGMVKKVPHLLRIVE
jgi:large subunit ribosomal protein L30